jgi:hypothetical protein
MNFLELIFTVCMIQNATVCEDKHIAVDNQQLSLTTCATCAMPTLARWAGDNPSWTIVRWHCDYSGHRDEPLVSQESKVFAFMLPTPTQ